MRATTDYLSKLKREGLKPHEWMSLIQHEEVVIRIQSGDGVPMYAAHVDGETYIAFEHSDKGRTLSEIGWEEVSLTAHIEKWHDRNTRMYGVEGVEPWRTPLEYLFVDRPD